MNMTKANLDSFRKDFNEAMKALNEKYDVDVHLKNIRYSDDSFTSKIEVQNRGESGEKVDLTLKKLETAFCNYAYRYNLEGQLGAIFERGGSKYKIIGMKPRSKTMPIVVEKISDGSRYKYAASSIQEALGLEVTPTDGH